MSPVFSIAANTVRQTVRDRIFYNVAFFGVGMLVLSMTVGSLTFGYPDRVVRSIGLSGVAFATDLVALLLGVTLIFQEIDRKTLFVVLTRPIWRVEYVLGRFLGLLATLAMTLAGFTVVFSLVLSSANGTLGAADVAALFSIFPEAAVMAGVGIVLSSFSTPTVGAGIGLGVWLAGSAVDDLVRLTEKSPALPRALAHAAYWVLPALARFNFRDAAVYAQPVELSFVLSAFGYGMIYAAGLVALAGLILSRREMV